MEEATKTIGFGPEALWITAGVLIALCAIALLIMNLIKTWRELRKPKLNDEQNMEKRLSNSEDRLSDLEDVAKKQEKEMLLILRSQVAMLHHMIDGNNTDALKRTQRDIENYLLTGKVNTD